ncbi:MAG TPA: hypothetical protein VJR89_40675, partial [Polyangiales bacterium]|nr:hypothetical protein [Polyangiales bacterium]
RQLAALTLALLSACRSGTETSVAIALLNLEEEPRRLLRVCLAKRCIDVNTVLDHGDEAIVTLQPRSDAPLSFTVEERGGSTRVLGCEARVPTGSTGSLKVALRGGRTRVLDNKLHVARARD